MITAQGAAIVFFTMITPIEVVYATRTLDAGTTGYGILLGTWGAGMLVGAMEFARRRAGLDGACMLWLSTAAIGIGYLGMAAAPGIVVACAASVVGGIGNGVQWIAHLTALQERTPARAAGPDRRPDGVGRRCGAGRRLPARRTAHRGRIDPSGVCAGGDRHPAPRAARSGGRLPSP